MNSTELNELPSYKNPPVNEVVCGIKFNTPANLKIPHVGLLWNKFKKNFPNVEHASLIISVPPMFKQQENLFNYPFQRVFFKNQEDDQLVQFQQDRFYFNWRRKNKDTEYPRYQFVIDHFNNTFNIIDSFFSEYELGKLMPLEYELSYINHIITDEKTNEINYLSNIFSFLNLNDNDFLKNPINILYVISYPLKDNLGQIDISLKRAYRKTDNQVLFVFELKTTGIVKSNDMKEHIKWFDIAHEAIVKGFTDMTTPEAHKIWGRER